MNARVSAREAVSLTSMLALLLSAGAAFSEEPASQSHPTMSKQQREKMATIHEQMAACLRSDKPAAECHKEAMKSCEEAMGKDGCSMMHEHMHDHKM
jgi:type II secretory pathway component PulF